MESSDQPIITALRARRSVRKFRAEHPGRERIAALVELATCAPSASNKQPWRFFVVDDRALLARMAAQVQTAIDLLTGRIPLDHRDDLRAYGDYFVRFAQAPVVIAPACRESPVLSHLLAESPADAHLTQVRTMESVSPILATGMAVQNLLLAAQADGLGASCLTGPLIAADALQELLGIPTSWRLACLVAVGIPDEQPLPTSRKPVTTALRWVDPAVSAGDSADGTRSMDQEQT